MDDVIVATQSKVLNCSEYVTVKYIRSLVSSVLQLTLLANRKPVIKYPIFLYFHISINSYFNLQKRSVFLVTLILRCFLKAPALKR